jgi:hypothetical protein
MNPEEKVSPPITTTVIAETKEVPKLEVETTIEPASIAPIITEPDRVADPSSPQQVLSEISGFVTKLTDSLKGLFNEGKKSNLSLIAIALLFIPLFILLSTILKFIDAVPLLAPTCELVGFASLIWFVYRYLLYANTRQELVDGVKGFTQKILG